MDELDLQAEIKKLREQSHDHSSLLMNHENRILGLEEDVSGIERTLIVLEQQSKILKWLLAVASAILVSIVSNAATL
jgi:hypothetical protein